MKKYLASALLTIILPFLQNETMIYVYVYDCNAQEVSNADVFFDFFFYVSEPTATDGNTYIYSGDGFDTVAVVVNGLSGRRKLTEGLMAENVIYCPVFIPFLGVDTKATP